MFLYNKRKQKQTYLSKQYTNYHIITRMIVNKINQTLEKYIEKQGNQSML